MAKERKTISVREAQEALQQMNLSYGRGAQITVDEDFNFALAESRDELAEESPEASLKRAERQEKNDGQPVGEVESKKVESKAS